MTSRERFEAWKISKLHNRFPEVFLRHETLDRYLLDLIQRDFESWQAAERDMLERAIAAAKNERLTGNTNKPTDLAYNTAISHVVYKLKELLNEQH